MANIYSNPDVMSSFRNAYFGADQFEMKSARCGDRIFNLPFVNGSPLIKWPFIDFYESVPSPENGARAADVPYLPKVAITTDMSVESQAGFDQKYPGHFWPAPFIDWKKYSGYEDFQAGVSRRSSSHWKNMKRIHNKLASDQLVARFVEADPNPESLRKLLEWKSRQFLTTTGRDVFANEHHKKLFWELSKLPSFRLSTLYFGERLVAAIAGLVLDGRRYYWIPSHDTEFNKYSPGRLLLSLLLEHSCNAKESEFDFMIGGEDYKWVYADGCRVIGELGTLPLALRIRRLIKQTLLTLGIIKRR